MLEHLYLWDGTDENGKPTLSVDHPRLDEDLATRIVKYMRSATLISRTSSTTPDQLDKSKLITFSSSVSTDGSWWWFEEVTYYVHHYRLAPAPVFIGHVAANNFVPGSPASGDHEELLRSHGFDI